MKKTHPKYLIYAHRLITNIEGGASERLKHQLIWNRTVNVNGGRRKNIPQDLHNEHLNKEYKENCRDAGGQLTTATINRHSQMLGIGRLLEKAYSEHVVSRPSYTSRKSGKIDRTNDIQCMVNSLHHFNLFKMIPSRYFHGFENFERYQGVTKPKKLKERLIKYRDAIARRRELQKMI